MEKESKYKKIEKLGEGAYGAVYKAQDLNTNQIVALKVSKLDSNDEGFPSTSVREISILKSLNHKFIIKLLDVQLFKGSNPRIQLAFEYMQYDLGKYIKKMKEQSVKGVTENEAKNIIKSILFGLRYLHNRDILHRDLKPQNILISKEGVVKIADFGLGRIACHPFATFSREIETLWYRSPELLLGTQNYGYAVDLWSVGCILYDLVEGRALFQGQTEIAQLFEIFKILGTPKRAEWPQMVDLPDFKKTFPKFIANPPKFDRLSEKGQEFMYKLLKPNPNARMTCHEALNHPYLEKCTVTDDKY